MHRLSAAGAAVAFVAVTMLALPALAQPSAEELGRINSRAMDAYNNLELDQARDLLEGAISSAEANGVHGPALARTYVNLGVIYVGGFNDTSRGLTMFVNGLREDASVELDPLVSTPEISEVFDTARSQAFSDAPRAKAGGPVPGNLNHEPTVEQLSQTGLPVYVEAGDDMEVATMRIFYRSLGMQEPASADMEPIADGWGYIIPCTDVFEPTVEYFIVAIDQGGQQVGNAGTPRNPVVVPIVSQRNQPAPSLPGQPPPSQCGGGEECPPGMAGCSGSGGLGDTCRSDNDCGDGLICSDNFCSVGEREEDGGSGSSSDAPRFFLRVGGGIGAAYVSDGMPAASPPDSLYFQDVRPAGMTPTPAELDILNGRAGDAGYRCDFSQAAIDDCKAIVRQAGFVATPTIRFEAGGYVTERISLSVIGRFQPGANGGTLAGFLLGGRVGYLVTQPAATGFYSNLFAGLNVGQIQPQPQPDQEPPPATYGIETIQEQPNELARAQENGFISPDGQTVTVTEDSPHVASGLYGFHAGTTLGYRFVRNFGLYLSPEVDFLMPDFLFNVDLTAGVELAF